MSEQTPVKKTVKQQIEAQVNRAAAAAARADALRQSIKWDGPNVRQHIGGEVFNLAVDARRFADQARNALKCRATAGQLKWATAKADYAWEEVVAIERAIDEACRKLPSGGTPFFRCKIDGRPTVR